TQASPHVLLVVDVPFVRLVDHLVGAVRHGVGRELLELFQSAVAAAVSEDGYRSGCEQAEDRGVDQFGGWVPDDDGDDDHPGDDHREEGVGVSQGKEGPTLKPFAYLPHPAAPYPFLNTELSGTNGRGGQR